MKPRRCIFCGCKLSWTNPDIVCRSALCGRIKMILKANGVNFVRISLLQESWTEIGRYFRIIGLAHGKNKLVRKRAILDMSTLNVRRESA